MWKKDQHNLSQSSGEDNDFEIRKSPSNTIRHVQIGPSSSITVLTLKNKFWACLILLVTIGTICLLSLNRTRSPTVPENIRQCWDPNISNNVEHYIVAATMIKNKRRYIREWIEFHLMMGISNFIFYDNNSEDGTEALIRPYIDAGQAIYITWPPKEYPNEEITDFYLENHFLTRLRECRENMRMKIKRVFYYIPCQQAAYDDAVRRTRGKARWVAGIDVDEYFYVPEDSPFWSTHPEQPLVGAFEKLEKYNGVTVSGQHFGTSGWYSFPRRDDDSQHAQMLTKTHLRHMEYMPGALVRAGEHVKPFVNPYCFYGNEIHHFEYDKDHLENLTYKTTHHNTNDNDSAIILMNHYLWPSYIENIEKVAKNVDPSTQYDETYDRFLSKDEGSYIDYLLERLEKRVEKAVISKPSTDGHPDDWDYKLKNRHVIDQKDKDLCVVLWNPQHIGLARHAIESIINYFFKVENRINYQLVVISKNTDNMIKKELEYDFPVDLLIEGEDTFSCSAEFILRINESSFAKWEQWSLEKPALLLGMTLLKENKKINTISLSDSSNLLGGWTQVGQVSYRPNPGLIQAGTYLMRNNGVIDKNIFEICLHTDDSCPHNTVKSLFEDYQQERLYDFKPGFEKKSESDVL